MVSIIGDFLRVTTSSNALFNNFLSCCATHFRYIVGNLKTIKIEHQGTSKRIQQRDFEIFLIIVREIVKRAKQTNNLISHLKVSALNF